MRLGFVVNPVAGMGGRVGLKGTDGVIEEAMKRGARPVSPTRATEFLQELKRTSATGARLPEFITCRGWMGENELRTAGVTAFEVLPIPASAVGLDGHKSTAGDTKAAVSAFLASGVDLLIFVGGDGTARDVLEALKELESDCENSATSADRAEGASSYSIPPVLGVPSGVKMYSAVFALNPVDAAQIVSLFIEGRATVSELEVMDVDESAFRRDELSIQLYGYMKCLYVPMMSQASKELSPDFEDERENQKAIAKTIIEAMKPDGLYVLGPGTTVKSLAEMLNVKKTTLGVDIYYKQKIIAVDADEKTIMKKIEEHGGSRAAWIIVSPIGRQGMIFGRGNQQISPRVIKDVGRDHILVIATKNKVRDLDGGTLKVDTGDRNVDDALRGYVKVITDYREWRMLPVR